MKNSERNVEIVKRAYEAFNAGDMKKLSEAFDEKASWHTPGKAPIAGDFKGREATFKQFGRYTGETKGTFKANLKRLSLSDDDHVIAVHHNSAKKNGKQLEVDALIDFELKDGKIIRGSEYIEDLYKWDEFWKS